MSELKVIPWSAHRRIQELYHEAQVDADRIVDGKHDDHAYGRCAALKSALTIICQESWTDEAKEIVKAWNTRAESAEIAELRAKVIELRDVADHGRQSVAETVAGRLCHQGEFKAYRRVLMLMERYGLTHEKSAATVAK